MKFDLESIWFIINKIQLIVCLALCLDDEIIIKYPQLRHLINLL